METHSDVSFWYKTKEMHIKWAELILGFCRFRSVGTDRGGGT